MRKHLRSKRHPRWNANNANNTNNTNNANNANNTNKQQQQPQPQPQPSLKGAYSLLGLRNDANITEINKAYKAAALKHHPDKGGDEEMFKEIQQAYELIKKQ